MPDRIDIAMDDIKEGLIAIKQRLSQYRKKGIDTKIVEMRMASIPSKLKMIEVTRDMKDIQKANQMLYAAKSDADELEMEYQAALKYKKPEEPDIAVEEVKYDMEEAKKAYERKDMSSSKSFYLKAYKSYGTLNNDQKKKVFDQLDKLRLLLAK